MRRGKLCIKETLKKINYVICGNNTNKASEFLTYLGWRLSLITDDALETSHLFISPYPALQCSDISGLIRR